MLWSNEGFEFGKGASSKGMLKFRRNGINFNSIGMSGTFSNRLSPLCLSVLFSHPSGFKFVKKKVDPGVFHPFASPALSFRYPSTLNWLFLCVFNALWLLALGFRASPWRQQPLASDPFTPPPPHSLDSQLNWPHNQHMHRGN